jgi:peptide/nickel transport system permease protein
MTGRVHSDRPGPAVWLAGAVTAAAFVAALFGHWIVPDATSQDLLRGIEPPSSEHLLGTDQLGRDVLALLVAGARTAVLGALAITVGSLIIGGAIGLAAGYLGGRVDAIAMRWVDLMFSVPALLVAIVVAGLFDGGLVLAVAVLAVLFSPNDARITRGAVLEQRHLPYVESLRLMDLSGWRIALGHVWPNASPIILAQSFLNFAFALVSLASLSFLGFGVDAGSPDWGRTLSDNRNQLFANPWASLAPTIAIIVSAAAVNLLGDWVHARVERRGTT